MEELSKQKAVEILINIVLTITTGTTIWMLGRVKEGDKTMKTKKETLDSTKNIFNV